MGSIGGKKEARMDGWTGGGERYFSRSVEAAIYSAYRIFVSIVLGDVLLFVTVLQIPTSMRLSLFLFDSGFMTF